jgi:hypothetical protein
VRPLSLSFNNATTRQVHNCHQLQRASVVRTEDRYPHATVHGALSATIKDLAENDIGHDGQRDLTEANKPADRVKT